MERKMENGGVHTAVMLARVVCYSTPAALSFHFLCSSTDILPLAALNTAAPLKNRPKTTQNTAFTCVHVVSGICKI